MLPRPEARVVQTIRSALPTMTRVERRRFQAQVVIDHCGGSTRLAKTVFGWDQETTRKALLEQETGTTIPDKPRKSRPSFSEKLSNLQKDIRSLVDPNSQTHPTFETTFRDAHDGQRRHRSPRAREGIYERRVACVEYDARVARQDG